MLKCCKKKDKTPEPPPPVDEDEGKWLKPLTKENILYYYMPIQGFVSYSALAVNVLNPGLVANMVGPRDITNVLLFNSLVGTSLYIMNRSHLQTLKPAKKAYYSCYNASMFTLGSILTWALLKTILPDNPSFNTIVALGTSYGLVKIGTDYMSFVDDAE